MIQTDDIIMFRNEWYKVIKYYASSVMAADDVGNRFEIPNKDIEVPPINIITRRCYA